MPKSQTKQFVFTKDNTSQVSYSRVSEDDVKRMGLKDDSKAFLDAKGFAIFVNDLLAEALRVSDPTELPPSNRHSFEPITERLSPPPTRTKDNCPFVYHQKNELSMREVMDWWSSNPGDRGPERLVALIERKWTTYPTQAELLTAAIMDLFIEELFWILAALGFCFSAHRQLEVGRKVPNLQKGLSEGRDYTRELVVIYRKKATLLSGIADLITILNLPEEMCCVGARRFIQPLTTFSSVSDYLDLQEEEYSRIVIHEFKREGNLIPKGAAQVKATSLARRTEQPYVFLTATEWTFGIIHLSTPLDATDPRSHTSTRRDSTLATIKLKYQDPHGKGKDEKKRVREIELIFKLWTAWNISPARPILDALVTQSEGGLLKMDPPADGVDLYIELDYESQDSNESL